MLPHSQEDRLGNNGEIGGGTPGAGDVCCLAPHVEIPSTLRAGAMTGGVRVPLRKEALVEPAGSSGFHNSGCVETAADVFREEPCESDTPNRQL